MNFEDKITQDNEITEVAENIASAIIDKAKNYGIAPEDSETFLKNVEVLSNVTNTTSKRSVY